MGGNDARRRGREAHARQAWDEAYQLLSSADQQSSLDPEDLERLATAAYLVGRDAVCDDVLARAHRGSWTEVTSAVRFGARSGSGTGCRHGARLLRVAAGCPAHSGSARTMPSTAPSAGTC